MNITSAYEYSLTQICQGVRLKDTLAKMKVSQQLGRELGHLGYSKRIIKFGTSPYEQVHFPNVMYSVPNVMKRMARQFLIVVPPLSLGWYSYIWMKHANHESKRKKPTDYVNDS
ncbi:hypothetical protein DPMN_114563 [Dreissena polymorpha]|uniref:Cytochrome b-c1 complex subunit 8 n=1 Tax=Dreissena polymorpha TaxID=45954 RepID=A0A9D4KL70_DREPO|nr:hypothetical protein DPMN_114563 [Dreissena polymorpha]